MFSDYCKIYISTDLFELSQIIEDNFLLTKEDAKYFKNSILEIYLLRNPDFTLDKQENIKDNFLYFSTLMECFLTDDSNLSQYISFLVSFLECLNHKDITAIAACDFEDKLPIKNRYLDS